SVSLRLAHLFMSAGNNLAPGGIDEPAGAVGFDFLREKPLASLGLIGLMADHPLREQPGEWFVEIEVAAALQRPGEEAGIKKMENRMLDPADILVDRHPVIDRPSIKRRRGSGRAEAQEVPR